MTEISSDQSGLHEADDTRDVVVDVRNLGLYYPTHRRRTLFKRITQRTVSRRFWALKDVSFQCRQGDVLGVVGRNGAGKSTLSLVLSSIFEPDEGEVVVKGEVSALLSLGGMFQSNLTGRDNTYYFGAFLGFSRAHMNRLIDGIREFSELGDFFDQPVGTYSSGMRARLAFSIGSSIEPDILVLDEVLSVGDPAFKKKCEARIGAMMSKCRCIIVISHQIPSIRKMCNKCLRLHQGRVVEWGDTAEVLARYEESLEEN